MSIQKSILGYIKREGVKRNPLEEVRNSSSKRFKSNLSDSGCDSDKKLADTENKDQSLGQVNELTCDDSNKSFEESNNSGSDILTGDSNNDPDDPEPRRWETNKIEKHRLTAKLRLLSNRCTILDSKMELDWFAAMEHTFSQPSFVKLNDFVNTQRKLTTVYPPQDLVWSWTKYCKVKDLKVVIIGQDPYHHYGQAHGLSFSVPVGVRKPPSLVNIFKELSKNYERMELPEHGYLMGWAMQGVLMLNVVLTVEENKPNSHKNVGWEDVTIGFIKYINEHLEGLVFMLWGKNAQILEEYIDKKKHHILTSGHPSPLSARLFFGCGHFLKCNTILKQLNKNIIDWSLLPSRAPQKEKKHHILTAGHPSQLMDIVFFGNRHFKKCNMILKEQHKVIINWGWLPEAEYEPGKEILDEIAGRKKLRIDKFQGDMLKQFLDMRLIPNISQYINFNDYTVTKKKYTRNTGRKKHTKKIKRTYKPHKFDYPI